MGTKSKITYLSFLNIFGARCFTISEGYSMNEMCSDSDKVHAVKSL